MAQQQETVYDRIEAASGIDVNAGLDAHRKIASMIRKKRQEILDLKEKNVDLEARFGQRGSNGSFWEHERKIELAQRELNHMNVAMAPKTPGGEVGKKPSDDHLDRLAHADPGYVEFIKNALATRQRYLAYQNQLSDLYDDLEALQSSLARIQIRLRMDEEGVRYTRAEANLSR